jgi:hypothetical protein
MKIHIFLSIIVLAALAGCSGRETNMSSLYNQEASLPDTLSINPLEWKVISSSFNRSNKTMSTLYGNDLAVKNARAGTAYPAGSEITLVTWLQKADEHWFGARVPASIQSIEQIRFNAGEKDSVLPFYEKKEGKLLRTTVSDDPETTKSRITYIAGQKASVMP